MAQQRTSETRETRLLREIGRIADKVRDLRQSDAVRNQDQIKSLSADLRGKWEELRASRAVPPANDFPPERRSLYR